MIYVAILLALPLLALIALLFLGKRSCAGKINIVASFAMFSVALLLAISVYSSKPVLLFDSQLYIDAVSVCFAVLTSFIAFTVAVYSNRYMANALESGRISLGMQRLYYMMYQAFIGAMLLVYLSNNIGLLWVAMEAATLATVLLVSLYRTPESIEAAWKYFILCIVGIALALFGTVCVYFAAKNTGVNINEAMLWSVLHQYAALLDPKIMTIAFIFLLVGYGTKVGLVPLHFWLPDAHSESPAPMSALLSGLLLNVGVYALVRFKMLADVVLKHNLAGNLFIVLGLLSFIVAVFSIYRQSNIKRMFSYSSIEHMGLILIAFGLGSPLAVFCALFYLIAHSLIKSSIFMAVGNVIQLYKSQNMNVIRGVFEVQPSVAWLLILSLIAIVGFPPFALFNSEIMLILAAFKSNSLLSVIILFGLLVALAGLLKNLHPVLYSKGSSDIKIINACSWPIVLSLLLASLFALYLPRSMATYIDHATAIIVGKGLLS